MAKTKSIEDRSQWLQIFMGVNGDHIPTQGRHGRRALCFASGSNRVAEMQGFASVGIPPGLTAHHLIFTDGTFSPIIEELACFKDTGFPIFLDSGAFSEFRKMRKAEQNGRDSTQLEITDADWRASLALYRHLAGMLGRQLYVVAPDKTADQAESLNRLRRYSLEMRDVATLDAQVLLPLQTGPLALDEFRLCAENILGFGTIPAFPMKAGASPRTVLTFVKAMMPKKIHLLGIGAANVKTQKLLKDLWKIKPDLQISQDSMFLRSRMEAWAIKKAFRDHPAAGQFSYAVTYAVLGNSAAKAFSDEPW